MESNTPYTSFLASNDSDGGDDTDDENSQMMGQAIMNRVYNRWIVEFSGEVAARRFVRLRHETGRGGMWKRRGFVMRSICSGRCLYDTYDIVDRCRLNDGLICHLRLHSR